MNGIKEGSLVKAWENNIEDYIIGRYVGGGYYDYFKVEFLGVNEILENWFSNCVEIPDNLAIQLEKLGDAV